MDTRNLVRLSPSIPLLLLFAGCGGGDDGGSQAQPTGQTPDPRGPITIFLNPTPQTYASLGSSSAISGGWGEYMPADARLTDVSLEAINQPLVRYTAPGDYEVQIPGDAFDRLVHVKGYSNPTSDNNQFQPSKTRQNFASFNISLSRFDDYRHTELASWSDGTKPRAGWLAFGTPAPSAAVPTSGSATYRGLVRGEVDITWSWDSAVFFSEVAGTITLNVDFATRTMTGTVEVGIAEWLAYAPVTYSVVTIPATTIPPGASPWSGYFESTESGSNEFKVRLAGPDASELIGSWAMPIVIEGQPHQLMGAWIAVRD